MPGGSGGYRPPQEQATTTLAQGETVDVLHANNTALGFSKGYTLNGSRAHGGTLANDIFHHQSSVKVKPAYANLWSLHHNFYTTPPSTDAQGAGDIYGDAKLKLTDPDFTLKTLVGETKDSIRAAHIAAATPLPGSPVIGAGKDLTALYSVTPMPAMLVDIQGRPIVSWNMGAIETVAPEAPQSVLSPRRPPGASGQTGPGRRGYRACSAT